MNDLRFISNVHTAERVVDGMAWTRCRIWTAAERAVSERMQTTCAGCIGWWIQKEGELAF